MNWVLNQMSEYIVAAKNGPRYMIIPEQGLDDDNKIQAKTEAALLNLKEEAVHGPIPVLSLTAHGHGFWEFYSYDEDKPKPEDLLDGIDYELPDDPSTMTPESHA